jgi:uncharacterized damage-inducible protein DinB
MNTSELLIDAFERVRDVTRNAVDGLSADQLAARPGPAANSIGWLVWHLLRVQDDHVADVAGLEQVWTAQGWMQKFGLPFDASVIGYGQNSADVAATVIGSVELLTGYLDAVHQQTVTYLGSLSDTELDRVVDERWDPPVTLAVRLISVISDDLQHAGQAAYVRGLLTTVE